MKKTIFICGLALLTSACACDCANVREYREPQTYAYEQPTDQLAPQQATITYRSYVQASYTKPMRPQVVYQPVMAQQPRPMVIQRPMPQPTCPCQQHRTCPCGC